ncbi:hypothetical protein [Aliivibrio fischeri]|uniref:hypothetical protein n=1 Tax=Aliivibrio fischeri TaxID=668 RepID=UPI0007C48DC0|nr:hypothetical protein [Aliivibrio fischeri]
MRNKFLILVLSAMSFFSFAVNASSDSTTPPTISVTPADNFQAGAGGWQAVPISSGSSTTGTVQLPSGSSFVSIEGQLFATNKSYSFTQSGSAGNCTWRVTPTYVTGCSASKYIPKKCTTSPAHCGANGSCPPITTCTPAKTVYTKKYIRDVFISK